VTFLVTASGVTLFGIGSAFWGLVAGVLTLVVLRASRRHVLALASRLSLKKRREDRAS